MNWYKKLKLAQLNDIQFTPHPHYNPDEDEIVHVNPQKFDAGWKQSDPHFYIGPNGEGADPKYKNFGQWVQTNKKVQMPLVSMQEDGGVGFLDGRNRFSYLRDQGLNSIPVVINKQHAPILKNKYSA